MKMRSVIPILLAVAVWLTYLNHFDNEFQFDDGHTIVNNAYIRDLANVPRFFYDATTFSTLPANQTYRPVVSTTLAIDYALGKGLNPFYFHLSTFILFLVQGAAMFVLFRRIIAATNPELPAGEVSLAAVAIYLLHPANAETINYIIARSDTLSTLGIVLALTLLPAEGGGRAVTWFLHLAFIAFGILAKPVAVVAVPLIFLHILYFRIRDPNCSPAPGPIRCAATRTLPAALLTVALMALVKAHSPASWTPGGSSRLRYFISQPFVIVHYFLNFFWPTGLSADSDWLPLESMSDWHFAIGVTFLAVLACLIVTTARERRWRPVSFGLAWFVIGLIPTSFVFPLAEILNDHRAFVSYVGLSLAVSTAGFLLLKKWTDGTQFDRELKGAAAALFLVYLVTFSRWTHERNSVWRTPESLWKDVTVNSPGNGRGWMNYGLCLMARGDLTGADTAFRTASITVPVYCELWINRGVLSAAMGHDVEAEEYFKGALKLDQSRSEPYYYYARFLSQRHRNAEAIPLLNTALKLSPGHIDARQLAAEIAQPDKPSRTTDELMNLSLAQYEAGRYASAIESAQRALALKPRYSPAYNNICACYNQLGQWDKAIAAGEQAVATDPMNELAKNNLEWARSHRSH